MVTTLYVVVMAIFYITYTWYLIYLKRHSRTQKVDWPMRWYDRASHGRDFIAQYTPPALLLLGVIEIGGAGTVIMHALGLMLLAAALLHVRAFGFPAHVRAGVAAMLLVTGMYGLASLIALAQLTGFT